MHILKLNILIFNIYLIILYMVILPKTLYLIEEIILEHLPTKTLKLHNFCISYPSLAFLDVLELHSNILPFAIKFHFIFFRKKKKKTNAFSQIFMHS